MLNKNDPLISAVQEVMKRNHAEREAAKVVNEKFGVYDRKALPHERQGEWDAAYKQVLSEGVEALDEMSEKQKKLAKVGNKAGLGGSPTKIDAPDLEGARKGHAKHIEEEQIDEVLDTSKKRMDYGMKAIGSYIKASLTGDKNTKRKRLAGNKNYKKKVAQAGEKRAMDSYREKKSGEVLRGMGRKTGLGQHYDKIFKEEHLNEKSPPGRADQVEALKKKFPDDRAFRIAWSSYNKSKKKNIDEGFNDRHGLSENASAKKQVVAVLNEDTSEYMDQEFERRGLQPSGGGMPGGGALKKTRVGGGRVRIDPGLKYINTGTGKKLKQTDIPRKKRTFVKKNSQTAQQQGPAKPPSGTFLDNLAKARRNVGMDKPAAPSLAAGAARRPSGVSTVPKIRQTGSSAGSNLPQGPWGGINRRGGASTRQTGLAAGTARRPAGQSTPPMRQQGTTLPPPKSSGLLRRGGAALAAGATALGVATTSVGNKPPAAQADSGPEKIKTSTQTTTTQPDYDKMTFGQAFKTARQQAGGAGGKFKYKGKEYQTNVQGTGTAKKPQEKYQSQSKLKTVAPAPTTKTTTSVAGGQGIAAVPGGTSSAAAKPVPSAAKERANFAGPPSGTSSLTRRVGPDGQGGIKLGQDKPMGMSFRPQTTVDAAKKPAASVTPQMSQSVSSLQQKASMAGKERGLAPREAQRELTRRQNIQTVKGA